MLGDGPLRRFDVVGEMHRVARPAEPAGHGRADQHLVIHIEQDRHRALNDARDARAASAPNRGRGPCPASALYHVTRMLNIDLTGRRALVAGVADDGGLGFAIAKALAEAGASVVVGTWPPALNIFLNLLERGKMDESRRLRDGSLLSFEKIYPLDAVFDTYDAIPEDLRTSKRYKD